MAKTKQQKEQEVQKLKDQLTNIKGAVFADYAGLKVDEMQALRSKLRETDSQYSAAKRSLLEIALKDSKLQGIDLEKMPGSISIATSAQDEVMPAKIMAEFAREHEALKIQGGILENSFIDTAKVGEIAKLPTKLELLARVVATIKAPVSGFVNVLGGNLRGLVRVLVAVRESKT